MNKYTLDTYVNLLKEKKLLIDYKIDSSTVQFISCNSKEVEDNTLFICKGVSFKEQFLKDAIGAGAACYVSETKYDFDTNYILVRDVRKAMAYISGMYYNNVFEKLNLIGITGTKGKSTTTYFLRYIFDEYLKSKNKPLSGVISSIDTYDGCTCYESHITTPESIDLHRLFNNAVNNKMEYMEMEVSSQALKYDRVLGVTFDVGAFLNIGYDHVSDIEHEDFEDYFQSKLMIFEQCKKACVNLNSERIDEILMASKKCKEVITFGLDIPTSDVYGYDVRKENHDIIFGVKTKRYQRDFRITIPGFFNVENALAAIAICEALNIPEQCIYVGLMKARVSGRMEVYENSNANVVAIVDYAHNGLSFEKLFDSIKEEYPDYKTTIVFGCPGYKALDRRKDLGTIAGKYANKTIITEEDAGAEPVHDICKEIATYVKEQKGNYQIIINRGQAIEEAILSCDAKTVVLITGKGNETRQKRGSEYIEVKTDVEYAKDALSKYDGLHQLNNTDKINSFIGLLPQLKSFTGQTVLIKYGGSAMEDQALINAVLEDISTLQLIGVRIVLVHGGGNEITSWINKLNIETIFKNGYRVTDKTTATVAEMVLSGNVNKNIVQSLEDIKVRAVGISGKDGDILIAKPKIVEGQDIGFVGEIEEVDPSLLITLLDAGYVPVVSPIGRDALGNTYNINADDAAYSIGQALKVDKLIFLTNTDGILVDGQNEDTTIRAMNITRAKSLIASGFVGGGMIPKLQNCIKAIENDVQKVVILDGRVEHSLLLESIEENRHGTTIIKE